MPMKPVIGLDADEVLLHGEMRGVALGAALEIIADAVFRVDIDRPHQPLFPERTLGLHRSANFKDTDCRDPHGALLPGRLILVERHDRRRAGRVPRGTRAGRSPSSPRS